MKCAWNPPHVVLHKQFWATNSISFLLSSFNTFFELCLWNCMNNSFSVPSCCFIHGILHLLHRTCNVLLAGILEPISSILPQKRCHNKHSHACPLRHPCEHFSSIPGSKGMSTKLCVIVARTTPQPVMPENPSTHPTDTWYHPPFQYCHSAGCPVASYCCFVFL